MRVEKFGCLIHAYLSGVPQGSPLGKIQYVIYVNGLPENLSADSLPYTCDVKLIAPPS